LFVVNTVELIHFDYDLSQLSSCEA
jgi:hypothetical protein